EAHTPSDLFLFLPGLHIAFMGDLLFVQNQPWLGDGDPDKWKTYLDSVAILKPEILVPGHGPIGNLSNIDTMKLYFQNVKDAATNYYKEGKLPKDDAKLKSPAPYDGWFLSDFYKPNVISEYDRIYKN
ncbi:MAG: MBL fold metallo-hydrolase, partial [Ginsengibacter sp.]